MAPTPTVGGLAKGYKAAQAAKAAKATQTFNDPILSTLSGARKPLPAGGFAAVIHSRRIAGPPAPTIASPKNVSSHTLTGQAAGPRYHTPTPAPAPTRSPGLAAGVVRPPVATPTPAASPTTPAPAPAQGFLPAVQAGQAITHAASPANFIAHTIAGMGGDAARSIAGGAGNVVGALPVTAAPVAAAPPPATGAPAAAAVSPAAAPDPYAGYPPEIAALLRMTDESSAAQQASLGGYFNNQALAAQDFANTIGTQTGHLAQLAGIPVGGDLATAGLGGAQTSLPGALSQIAQHLGAVQGLNTTNAAAMLPGFLRQQGTQAQTSISSANLKAHGQIISDYITRQAELAKVEAQQAGANAREANQAATNARIQAGHDVARNYGNVLKLAGIQITAGGRVNVANVNAAAGDQAAQTQAGATLGAAAIRASSTGQGAQSTTAAKTAANYSKLRAATAPKVRDMLLGQRIATGTTSSKNAQGQTVSQKSYGYTGGQAPDAVMAQLMASGITPKDAYNMTVSAARGGVPDSSGTIHDLQNPWTDFYYALLSAGQPSAQAIATVQRVTGHKMTTQDFTDAAGHPFLGP